MVIFPCTVATQIVVHNIICSVQANCCTTIWSAQVPVCTSFLHSKQNLLYCNDVGSDTNVLIGTLKHDIDNWNFHNYFYFLKNALIDAWLLVFCFTYIAVLHWQRRAWTLDIHVNHQCHTSVARFQDLPSTTVSTLCSHHGCCLRHTSSFTRRTGAPLLHQKGPKETTSSISHSGL